MPTVKFTGLTEQGAKEMRAWFLSRGCSDYATWMDIQGTGLELDRPHIKSLSGYVDDTQEITISMWTYRELNGQRPE